MGACRAAHGLPAPPCPRPGGFLARRGLQNHMGGCQNYGILLGPLNTRCLILLRIQKGTIILTTTHIPQADLNIMIFVVIKAPLLGHLVGSGFGLVVDTSLVPSGVASLRTR